ncbi:OCIA domain-containing protein 1 [Cylas formicarius]|uniref:OCIA domain-containing protein 1 n=1 Tax=Cylas formicarius TaxID=197179 RepID=UPI0029589437|nr:OCIA domain-containing protein 1 [Cylas formicarius]
MQQGELFPKMPPTLRPIRRGYILRSQNRFGATPKVMAAVAVGYFVGKFSYQGKCAEKLMQLPNSPLGQMIRARKEGRLPEGTESGFGPSVSLSPFSGITDSYSDISPGSQDIDLDRPQLDGLDDSFRPSVDNPIVIQEEEMPPEQKHVTTYEELRKKNREEYEQKRLSSYSSRESPKESRQLPATVPSTEAREEFPKSARRNKYGDIME